MQLQVILNHVERNKSFVYKHVSWDKAGFVLLCRLQETFHGVSFAEIR